MQKKDDVAVTRISFIGYSLGGLINRYVIGKLYAKRFFDTIQPINFITIATPHLGVRKRGLQTIERIFNSMVSVLTSRSGMQMSLDDVYYQGLPLLVIMSIPTLPFYKALSMFKRRQAFANIRMDRTVPYTTAAFSRQNPYHRWVPIPGYGEKYPSLVKPGPREYVKEPWTPRGRMTVAVLIVLSPLLLPLYLLIGIPTLAGVSLWHWPGCETYLRCPVYM